HKVCISHGQLRQISQIVHKPCAAHTTFLPCRVEHEMVHDELALAIKQIQQALFAFGTVKQVGFFNFYHWQPAALSTTAVGMSGCLLSMFQERLPGGQPLFPCRDTWMRQILTSHG